MIIRFTSSSRIRGVSPKTRFISLADLTPLRATLSRDTTESWTYLLESLRERERERAIWLLNDAKLLKKYIIKSESNYAPIVTHFGHESCGLDVGRSGQRIWSLVVHDHAMLLVKLWPRQLSACSYQRVRVRLCKLVHSHELFVWWS